MHKMWTRIFVAVILLMIVAATAACRAPVGGEEAGGNDPEPEITVITLTDDLSRQVTLEQPAARVVSLAPSNTEILFAVDAGSLVIGRTEFCNYPEDAGDLSTVGGFAADSISVEFIVGLKPDLVLSAGSIHYPVIEALQDMDIPVFAIDPDDFEGIYASIEAVGRLVGRTDEARVLVEDMRRRAKEVSNVVDQIPAGDRVSVYWEIWHEPLMAAGPASFIGQLLDKAGGSNIFSDITDQQFPQVSSEEILRRDPLAILGPEHHGSQLTVDALAARPGWDKLSAVQDSRVYLVDGDTVSRAGPRIVDGLEQVARALYPDLFR